MWESAESWMTTDMLYNNSVIFVYNMILFLSGLGCVNLSGRTLLHGVS
jgi:hypothetical protein